MPDTINPLKSMTEQEQAVYFHSRERRRSLAGLPELFRTHLTFNEARSLTVTDATNATPIVITTSVDHGLVTGMTTTVSGVTGNTAANTTATATVLTTTTYELDGTVGNGAYAGGGQADVTPDLPVPDISSDQFPTRDTLVTFRTAIRILAGTGGGADEHRGLVFELGDSTIGAALWIDDEDIYFRAGEDGTVNGASAVFSNGGELPEGLELDLVAAIRPGDGRVRLWANGTEIARASSSGGDFGAAGTWMAASDGSFASAVQGTTTPDVTNTGAPSGFEVIEPLSVYMGQVPRHFV